MIPAITKISARYDLLIPKVFDKPLVVYCILVQLINAFMFSKVLNMWSEGYPFS